MAFVNAFSECEMRFTKGPIFIAHQVQHRQQLRLGELPFAELRGTPLHPRSQTNRCRARASLLLAGNRAGGNWLPSAADVFAHGESHLALR